MPINKIIQNKKAELVSGEVSKVINQVVKQIVNADFEEKDLLITKLVDVMASMYLKGYADAVAGDEKSKKIKKGTAKEELLEIINEVENDEFLEFVYRFTLRLKQNWGL